MLKEPRKLKPRTRSRNRTYLYSFRKKQQARDRQGPSRIDGRPLRRNRISIHGKHICRLSCSCHKNNLAVRKAIQYNPEFSAELKELSSFAGQHRKTISTCRLMIGLKIRLQVNNKTRWMSAFTMMLTFKKAYERGERFKKLS